MFNNFIPLPGYETMYAINRKGVVKRLSRTIKDVKGRLTCIDKAYIKTRVDQRTGYIVVKLSKPDGSYGSQFLHRLLAQAFIPNPGGKEYINHRDGVKTNYKLDNLEWVDKSENQLHAIKQGLARIPAKNKTPVINMCTGETYQTMKEAAQKNNIPYNRFKQKLNGYIKNDTCLQKAA